MEVMAGPRQSQIVNQNLVKSHWLREVWGDFPLGEAALHCLDDWPD